VKLIGGEIDYIFQFRQSPEAVHMNRIDRLTAMIIYLQGRKRVKIGELAGRYEISERTVFRDLRALQETGVPIGFEPGSGYFIVKGYYLPPVMFDRNEASALLAGERLMQKWNTSEPGRSYKSALDKIRAILPPEEKQYIDLMDENIQLISYRNDYEPKSGVHLFTDLQNAIFRNEVIEIVYLSPYKEKETVRRVEPLGLLIMGNHWYLAGWCQLRKDYRMFRLDRFQSCRPAGNMGQGPHVHTLQDFYDRHLQNEPELTEAVIHFDREMVKYIGDQKYRYGWAWEKPVEGGIEMTFLTSSIEYFSRWLLIWGNSIKILKPLQVENRLKELVKELHNHYLL
jgi:predicted DNA-binding transcriptional regulator YafY